MRSHEAEFVEQMLNANQPRMQELGSYAMIHGMLSVYLFGKLHAP